jgi:putative transposase
VPLRGFKYRFYPTAEQETLLRRTIGCCRLVYNRALHARSEAWTSGKKSIGYAAQSAALTSWKKDPELAFLNEVSSVPVQQTLRHLQTAYANFFAKRAKYPSFKKKRARGSAEFTRSGFRFDAGKLTLAKMDAPLDIRWSRPLPEGAQPSSASVSLDSAQRWHVSLLCEDRTVKPLPKLKTAVGIDLGINALATLSTGEKIPNLKYDAQEMKRKRRLSRALARKQKGSKNRNKARIKLAHLHSKVADRRRDQLHKISSRLVHENQVIVVEDLNVAGMVRNHCLARVISDAAWRMLLTFLAYKCAWYGREFVKVDRFYPSSKTCSACGHVVERLSLDVRKWTCPSCQAKHDRDENAAKNILASGLDVARKSKVSGSGVSRHVLRNVLQSELKEKSSVVKPGIRLL